MWYKYNYYSLIQLKVTATTKEQKKQYSWPKYYYYYRSGFEFVVKQLWMVQYKPDYDSNDSELPRGEATPSTLAEGVAYSEAVGY